MRDDSRSRIRRLAKNLLIAAFLGLALGYTTFYSIFVNVSAPAAGEPSFLSIGGILVTAALVAGLATEDLPACVTQTFLAIPLGIGTAFAIAVSPSLTGFLEVRTDDILSFIVRLGLPVYLLAIPTYLVASLAGLLLRERFGLRSASYRRSHAADHRK